LQEGPGSVWLKGLEEFSLGEYLVAHVQVALWESYSARNLLAESLVLVCCVRPRFFFNWKSGADARYQKK